jgi:hypothetical protein
MAPRPVVDTDRKLADRNLVVALLRSFGRKGENTAGESPRQPHPKEGPENPTDAQ